jgi:hypothetical protein
MTFDEKVLLVLILLRHSCVFLSSSPRLFCACSLAHLSSSSTSTSFVVLILFGFFLPFGLSFGRKSYLGNLILCLVSTTWDLKTVPSFLTPSCPSRCDDPGDGSCVAFRFRRECDGIEAMRWAGNVAGFVFLSRSSVPNEFRCLTKAECEG